MNPQRQIIILWSRDGNFDNTPGAVYQPNHIVSLRKKKRKRPIAIDV